MKIQTIDLANFKSRQDAIIDQVRLACESLGAFYGKSYHRPVSLRIIIYLLLNVHSPLCLVENHGIPEHVLQRCLDVSAEFFSLSDEAKLLLYQEDPVSVNIGYRGINDSHIDPDGTKDCVEGLTLGWDGEVGSPTGNKWPAEVPALRQAVLDYYEHAAKLEKLLYRAISLAMGLGEDLGERSLIQRGCVFYGIRDAGVHSDFGNVTILLQQPEIDALQVVDADGGWSSIPPLPGTLLVNPGDQVTICTNGVVKSSLHRFLSRPGGHRHSIPLFFFADFDAVLEPDDSFVTEERPAEYKPFTAGEHLAKRVAASRTK
ncbi:hypothetical protein C8R43DRAFT_1201931 [Mycena crocata]|nr:hypothetical protein C8R43DRAFT_1201931 [Mycena crocata]